MKNTFLHSTSETANLEPRVAIIEGHDSSKQFIIIEGYSRKPDGSRNQLTYYHHEGLDLDGARNLFWSQVFNDPESLWRLIDYAIPKTE